jgi:hypothetical protein
VRVGVSGPIALAHEKGRAREAGVLEDVLLQDVAPGTWL